MECADLLSYLSTELGLEVKPDADGLFDVVAGNHLITVRMEESGRDWSYSTFLFEDPAPEPLDEAMLRRALSLNLMGAATNGHFLGLFGESLLLSGRVAGGALSPEEFVERLLLLARTADRLAEELRGGVQPSGTPTGPVPSDAFIAV